MKVYIVYDYIDYEGYIIDSIEIFTQEFSAKEELALREIDNKFLKHAIVEKELNQN